MTNEKYLGMVAKLENSDLEKIKERFTQDQSIRLLHAAIGMCTETGEFQDLLKKKLFYGKEIETSKLIDELGDLLWYAGLACNVLGVKFEDVMEKNYIKLSTRYGDKFTENAALNKDKQKEWEAMNNGKEQGR